MDAVKIAGPGGDGPTRCSPLGPLKLLLECQAELLDLGSALFPGVAAIAGKAQIEAGDEVRQEVLEPAPRFFGAHDLGLQPVTPSQRDAVEPAHPQRPGEAGNRKDSESHQVNEVLCVKVCHHFGQAPLGDLSAPEF